MHYNSQMHSYKEFLEDTVNKFELPYLWNEATALQLEQIQRSESKKKIKRNNNPFVTIDGEDAKDFDDAIFCKKIKGGFSLEVAIANPAAYIEKDSPLDKEAFKRGTSVYFPNFVIPMLPELLSNELCSLNPNKPKLTIVCSMTFNEEAENISYQFFEQEIISKQRLTYKEVNNFFSNKQIKFAKDVNSSIIALKDFASKRLELKKNRNALSINSTEIEVTLNHIQEPTKIIRRKNGFSESMIEEAMIAANICAAKFLENHSRSLLYRIHEEPQEDKLNTAQEVLRSKEFKRLPAAKLINSLAQKYFNNPLSSILILQTLPRAIYSIENKGHFGLGLEHYAHFTSPIRRYPDLILHRLYIADISSKNEKNAEQAMRSFLQKLVCKYLEKKIGSVFKGVISGLSDFGIFVILDDYYSSGLIHISNIGHGRYIFDAKKITMRNKKSGHTLKVGMMVEVKILNVVPMEGKIDLKLIRSHGNK
ncbi:MAG: RNB domain-containing ribonuclease [Proteobacteria bacterium]|nr:RNB domain-containing ribonuclease [Pseudomonadota bacterium]